MSIPPNNEADSDEKFHVGVCHGVAVYKDTGGDTFRVWYVITADSEAGLLLGGRALDQPSSAIS